MAVVVWGVLEKSQVDSETIEEAVARLIQAHEDDTNAHVEVGESLYSHKAAEIIDHLVASVVADKIKDLNVTTGKLANLAVTEAKIGSLAVTNAKIGSLAVTELKIGSLAITDGKLGNLAVTTGKLGNLAVSEGKLGNLSVAEAKIQASAVSENKIADFSVTNAKIGNLAVTNAKINDLSADKINVGTLTGRTVQSSSGNNRIVLTNGDILKFYYNNVQTSEIRGSANAIQIKATRDPTETPAIYLQIQSSIKFAVYNGFVDFTVPLGFPCLSADPDPMTGLIFYHTGSKRFRGYGGDPVGWHDIPWDMDLP